MRLVGVARACLIRTAGKSRRRFLRAHPYHIDYEPGHDRSAIGILIQSINDENKNVLEAMSYREDTKVHTGTLSHVDDYACALKSTLETVQRQMLDKISAIRTEHNRLIPLHRLPIENFVQIITGALEPFNTRGYSGPTHLARLVALCEVCRRWREVINSTPSFWTTIDILDPPAVTSAAISRSANHRLNFIGAPRSGAVRFASRPPDRCAEFSRTAMMHSTRWRSIELVAASPEDVLAIMNAPAPVLQSLEMKSMAPSQLYFQNGASMFQNTNPRLRRLGLHGVAIPWDSSILRDLQYLSISTLDNFVPSCEEILRILRACPGLVEVHLSLKLIATVKTSKKGPPFTLPQLVSMSFSLSPSSTLVLLKTIRAPSVQSVNLDLDFNSDPSRLLSPIIKSTHALSATALGEQYRLLITLSHHRCLSWSCEPAGTYCSGRKFTITTRGKPATETVDVLLTEIDASRFTLGHRDIELHFDCTYYLNISTFLEKLDGVDRITTITAASCDIDPLFTYMSGATMDDDWGFPNLEGLTIYDCDYEPSLLLGMIKARYGLEEEDSEDSEDDGRDLPPPLKWMTISHVSGEADKDTLDLVEEILGPGSFELHEDVER
ncbi:hypothetical protein FRC05_006927 [Tulasnella sp. 425]|nr:hypothetical protein FRC05_006927 [Tulasnella sp. 425]